MNFLKGTVLFAGRNFTRFRSMYTHVIDMVNGLNSVLGHVSVKMRKIMKLEMILTMSSNYNPLEHLMSDVSELPKILDWFSSNMDKLPIHLELEHLRLKTKYAAEMKKLYIAALLTIPGEEITGRKNKGGDE